MATKVIVQKNTIPATSFEILAKWASSKSIELVDPAGAKSAKEFLGLAEQHQPFALINSNGLKGAGGWSDELVSGLPSSVKAICNFSAGYDNMGDMSRYKAKNIEVANTPRGVAQATADTGLYLILGALRNFGALADNLRAGKFLDGISMTEEYDNKTLGILGLGGVGSLVRDKCAAAFDFEKIQYHNRRRASPETEKGASYVSLDELLATSDVILIVLPLSPATHHLINKQTLAKTKKGAIIVNIGRGPLIDEAALAESLASGHLGGVGLDVYEHEPKINAKLLECKNALLLPHVGTHTTTSRNKMMRELIANLESVLETGKVIDLVADLRT